MNATLHRMTNECNAALNVHDVHIWIGSSFQMILHIFGHMSGTFSYNLIISNCLNQLFTVREKMFTNWINHHFNLFSFLKMLSYIFYFVILPTSRYLYRSQNYRSNCPTDRTRNFSSIFWRTFLVPLVGIKDNLLCNLENGIDIRNVECFAKYNI